MPGSTTASIDAVVGVCEPDRRGTDGS